MTEAEEKAVEYLKANSLVRLNENNEVVAYGNAHKYYIINLIKKLQKEIEKLKNKVIKRDNDIIYLEETAEKELLTKIEVKENYISKDKIGEIRNKNVGQYMNFYREIEKLLEEDQHE